MHVSLWLVLLYFRMCGHFSFIIITWHFSINACKSNALLCCSLRRISTYFLRSVAILRKTGRKKWAILTETFESSGNLNSSSRRKRKIKGHVWRTKKLRNREKEKKRRKNSATYSRVSPNFRHSNFLHREFGKKLGDHADAAIGARRHCCYPVVDCYLYC